MPVQALGAEQTYNKSNIDAIKICFFNKNLLRFQYIFLPS